jgi:hypothetical protein
MTSTACKRLLARPAGPCTLRQALSQRSNGRLHLDPPVVAGF